MADDKVPDEKKPGEKAEGKLHYNPVNMSGKSAETPKDVEQEHAKNRDQ